jgi:hypothetical protein
MADLTLTAAQIAPVFPHDAKIYDIIAGVAVTAGQAVRENTSGKAALCDANAGSGAEKFYGLALKTKGIGQGLSVLKEGHVYGFDLSSLAYGALVYLSDTAGALADTPSTTNSVPVGFVAPLSDSDVTKVLYIRAQWVPAVFAGIISVSAEQTGTGSAQNVAHGLGVIPRFVMVSPTDLTPATVGSYVVTEGTHTTTNVVVTVTTSKKFKVLAIA